ncbi:phosphoenolpyruvate-protein phosphotransferase [Staphylococcus saprophyticus]|jgi:phosphotransferase system enzyme I (PtsI)|uniref:Phosphoenolpyruvate-protein phosphotransferase n=1 Tax=Staphylococcus saprophyticus subsp. saprophyticus (strain ATCC 15305 / DSM 20229 / NCIMB 8711 / NCTC 7292 / S-41) TaxID=342451 RepID=Q49WK7_STAS1|nr:MULTISPECIES: phosphoenolpyruvate--protein phosphotransferase [Staphylococcus]AMG20794.1 phosphoenolpyruvate--protein phosphotransferase [Staphylococcus saprophyticus]AMG33865.1 phosphoenolpyruvate--protein phosphotransferase [Staphylococcus saprophyticus]ASE59709.1 phosphoenolpyruvate--protein phosphotransferase [Staphylococcus saprophyticus]ASF18511.1 phosphoenolpyruvate--protein phosphotransferase [Staphylococcus saprophyticus]MBC2921205.1 phosphoenolpyruvate--protein phosphotransferase 
MSNYINGIAASDGVAIAKAYLLVEPDLSFDSEKVSDVDAEIAKFNNAIQTSKVELTKIRNNAEQNLGADKAAIFDAHLLVLDDPELIQPIEEKIKNEQVNAPTALSDVTGQFITIFESMDNEYMKERAADIRDVSKRVLAHILGVELPNPSMIDESVVIIGNDLTPSDTAQLNKEFVQGFVTNIGGRTSHSAIMSRSLEIAAVVGTKSITQEVKQGDMIIVDGLTGEVIIDPTEDEVIAYQNKRERFFEDKQELQKLRDEETTTIDGRHAELTANIGTPNDLKGVIENGAEGIGLYRTEFLYMGRDEMPTEDEQFEAYKKVLETMEDKRVVVRTLDIGGDKELPYLNLPEEMNPFLGYRAIRLCLDQPDIFRPQLRALLRASAFGKLNIMFPMVATIQEFRDAKALLLEEKDNLTNEGIEVSDDIELGIMVEIPSTAALADVFAKEVDFFSIGTNDLIQYTMAADRMSERVSYLYQPYNPSILRLVKQVIEASHKEGKWTGMCGEMAGDEIAIPLLLGLGLDEFSMSATSVLKARRQIKGLSQNEMEELAQRAIDCATSEEVQDLVNQYAK